MISWGLGRQQHRRMFVLLETWQGMWQDFCDKGAPTQSPVWPEAATVKDRIQPLVSGSPEMPSRPQNSRPTSPMSRESSSLVAKNTGSQIAPEEGWVLLREQDPLGDVSWPLRGGGPFWSRFSRRQLPSSFL